MNGIVRLSWLVVIAASVAGCQTTSWLKTTSSQQAPPPVVRDEPIPLPPVDSEFAAPGVAAPGVATCTPEKSNWFKRVFCSPLDPKLEEERLQRSRAQRECREANKGKWDDFPYTD